MRENRYTVKSHGVTDEQMEKIGRYTRRSLDREELFVFSVALCDNEIDRDMECFDDDALEKLAELFLGKTGVFDHAAKAENQSARIFDAAVVEGGETNSLGASYRYLKAWAYMARCEKNTDLILEIDAGIKKEVSVGCAVEQTVCSVCGQNQRAGSCDHQKGQKYGDSVCYHLLQNPTDAYEWSFVAVPAQKNAGVVKTHRMGTGREESLLYLHKLFREEGEITLSAVQRKQLAGEYQSLRELAREGEVCLENLRREVVKLTLLSRPGLDSAVMEQVAGAMDATQLKAFQKAFSAGLEKSCPMPQLAAGQTEKQAESMTAFKM